MADADPTLEGEARPGDPQTNQGEGNHPPNEGNWVPLERAESMARNAAENVRAELTSKFDAQINDLKTQQQQPAKPVYTRDELQALVDDGKLSEAGRDQVLFKQAETQIRSDISKDVKSTLELHDRNASLSGQIGQYTATLPALHDRTSDARQRVEREFLSLTQKFGMSKDDLATELLAIRNTFGPIESLQSQGKSEYEHHQETGGSRDGDKGGDDDDAPKDLTGKQRRYYEGQIAKGRYKDWTAVKKLLSYKRPEVNHGKAVA